MPLDSPYPLVSVITPTWQRHDSLLDRCIPSVRAQTYQGHIDHWVVSDGPDAVLWDRIQEQRSIWKNDDLWYRLLYRWLGDHDPNVRFGNRCRVYAREGVLYAPVSKHGVVMYLDDDNAWRPDHVELLVRELFKTGADFAFSRMLRHPNGDEVGSPPPRYAQLDTSILAHLAGIEPVGWNPGQRADPDWEAVEAWLQAGRSWCHVPQVTCDYYFKGH